MKSKGLSPLPVFVRKSAARTSSPKWISNARWLTVTLVTSFGLIPAVLASCVAQSTPRPGPRVRVSPPLVGNHSLIDLSIDPDAGGDVFACGYRFSASENAMIGFVYRSQDGGRSWREVVKDNSSAWVSEESCASGAGGRVFFMAESAFLEHGRVPVGVPLQERGDIHLYASSDGGRSWTMMSKRGWLDHTAMAIDWSNGPRRGRMYLFGQASSQRESGSFNQLQLVASDGKTLPDPVSLLMPKGFRYLAAYASAARVLPNGDVLAVFLTNRSSPSNTDSSGLGFTTHAEVFASRDGGQSLQAVAEFGPVHPCLGAMPSLDVNSRDGTVFVVWGNFENGHCQIAISSTNDAGHTWSAPHGVVDDGYVPSVAVNKSGVVGLLWLDGDESHCWRFAASSDNGRTFSDPIPVSRCVASSTTANLSQSMRDASPEVHREGNGPGWTLEPDAIGFSVIAARDGLIPDRTGLAADADGIFHATWPEATDQNGALWSGTILVNSLNPAVLSDDAKDVSHEVALEFENSVFEPTSGMYAVDVTVTNTGDKPIEGQIFLRVENAYSRFFKTVTPIDSDDQKSLGRALWAIWPKDRKNYLNPGERSSSRRLSFLLREKFCNAASFGDLLAVRLTALSGRGGSTQTPHFFLVPETGTRRRNRSQEQGHVLRGR